MRSSAMAFVATLRFPPASSLSPRRRHVCAQYLAPEGINVRFDQMDKAGNFGGVFFGQYSDPGNPDKFMDVVVKCPIESDLGRQLYRMEKYTNAKLKQMSAKRVRFPPYLGEVIIPPGSPIASGLAPLGLVWRRVGNGDTLEDFLTTAKVSQLAGFLGVSSHESPLRRQLAAKIIFELALVLKDLQKCGIVHR